MKNIKEKVLKKMKLIADRGAPHDEAIDLTLAEVSKDLNENIKKLEKERKVFSDLNDEETKDLVRVLENYKVPKIIETPKQERNCEQKAMFIFGKFQSLKELKQKLGIK